MLSVTNTADLAGKRTYVANPTNNPLLPAVTKLQHWRQGECAAQLCFGADEQGGDDVAWTHTEARYGD
jgi:hypothetical protein